MPLNKAYDASGDLSLSVVGGIPQKDTLQDVDVNSTRRLSDMGYLEPNGGFLGNSLHSTREWVKRKVTMHSSLAKGSLKYISYLLLVAYAVAVIAIFAKSGRGLDWCRGHGMAFLIIGLVLWCILYYKILKPSFLRSSLEVSMPSGGTYFFIGKWIIIVIAVVFFLAFVIYDAWEESHRLISLSGILFFIIIGFVFTKHPQYIKWDTVLAGIALQTIIGIITIRWETGRRVFECAGSLVAHFLEYGYAGATVVYGDLLVTINPTLAFQALSVLYFLSMIVRVLFHLGWVQIFCHKIGGAIQWAIGTTVIESINAVATVFLGMSEAPLIYAPYIKSLTPSELHAIMTAGFATVAGTMLAAYTSLGIDPKNIVTASSMAAPGALGMAKLFYPENRVSSTSNATIQIIKGEDKTLVDALCSGASVAVSIVLGIIANVIAFVSLIAFLDGAFEWLGNLVDIEDLSFQNVLATIFIPMTYLMGVEKSQVRSVAKLIGIKSVVNEFVAYAELGKMKRCGMLSIRSEAIATFALCGFANPGSMGIFVATLSSLSPEKGEVISKVVLRAFIAGSMTSFISACVAGLLIPEKGFSNEDYGMRLLLNSTDCNNMKKF